jgi:phosphatidylserine/phosphatidylglycerophosphate/cardiolipin synthase-like enzyme
MTLRFPLAWISVLLLVAGCNKEEQVGKYKSAGAEDGVAVFFSPQTDCRKLIINQIREAQKTIHLQAYSFSSERIARALVDAKKMGVKVTVIIDGTKADGKSETGFLAKKGIDTHVDAEHEKAHNKVILIDGKTIITGSFNFSDGDEDSTADNMLIIRDKPKLMEAYEENFQGHLRHSKKQDREGR